MSASIILGLILIVIGLATLLGEFFHVNIWLYVFEYWPLLLVLWGLLRFRDIRNSKTANLILILVGIILQLNQFGWIRGNMWTILWSLAIILVGLALLFPDKAYKNRYPYQGQDRTSQADTRNDSLGSATESGENKGGQASQGRKNLKLHPGDVLHENFFLRDENIYMDSNNFSGGKISVILARVYLDLSKVTPLDETIELDSIIRFGELRIRVPIDWDVYVNGRNYFEQAPGHVAKAASGSYRLYINSTITLGELYVL